MLRHVLILTLWSALGNHCNDICGCNDHINILQILHSTSFYSFPRNPLLFICTFKCIMVSGKIGRFLDCKNIFCQSDSGQDWGKMAICHLLKSPVKKKQESRQSRDHRLCNGQWNPEIQTEWESLDLSMMEKHRGPMGNYCISLFSSIQVSTVSMALHLLVAEIKLLHSITLEVV